MAGQECELAEICQHYGVSTLYAFGSRALQAFSWLRGELDHLEASTSDLDVGAKLRRDCQLSVEDKVRLALALEDLFDVGRVDLVLLHEADPFLAASIIRGERLYARDTYEADEYDLYVLRRAGDLAPLERERLDLILHGGRHQGDP
jgi:predicted nucleotidyltransferase